MSNDAEEQTPVRRIERLAARLYPYYNRYERDQDPRAVFAYVYHHITQDLAERLREPGAFDDPDWVASLAHAFGTRYVIAMDAIDTWERDTYTPGDSGSLETIYDAVARPWADVYRAICHEKSYVLEDVVFSMAAHISYDLPFALLDAGLDTTQLADYHRMNDVLANQTERIQEAVSARYNTTLGSLDRLARAHDEFFTNYGIRVARAVAWYNAARLSEPSSHEAALGSIERSTNAFIESTRRPPEVSLRLAVGVVRVVLPPRRRWPEVDDSIPVHDVSSSVRPPSR